MTITNQDQRPEDGPSFLVNKSVVNNINVFEMIEFMKE